MSKRIIILGAGESGVGAALLAKSKGYNVFVSDAAKIKAGFKQELIENDISFEEFGHSIDLIEGVLIKGKDLVIKSPGIPFGIPMVDKAFEEGIEVIDEIEFAYRHTDKPIIAITGTNGKTTTTLLIHHLLSKSGINAGLAGNVGHSLARQVIADTAEVYVVEVSSFQLDGVKTFRPTIAIILNITPDHLDRYNNDFEQYVNSKMNIIRNMDKPDLILFFGDDPNLQEKVHEHELELKRGHGHEHEHEHERWPTKTYIGFKGNLLSMGHLTEKGLYIFTLKGQYDIAQKYWPLKGEHNVLNMLFAIYAVLEYGVSIEQVLTHLPTFKNAPNRMEFITSIKGVDFINDTKATNVEAVYYALGSYSNNIIWIAGGQDKGNDYTQIATLVVEKVKAMVCLGADNKKLTDFFGSLVSNTSETKDVKEAVRMALEYANKGDVVLLSPACASFDLFDNYAQRGKLFKEAVFQLKAETDG